MSLLTCLLGPHTHALITPGFAFLLFLKTECHRRLQLVDREGGITGIVAGYLVAEIHQL